MASKQSSSTDGDDGGYVVSEHRFATQSGDIGSGHGYATECKMVYGPHTIYSKRIAILADSTEIYSPVVLAQPVASASAV